MNRTGYALTILAIIPPNGLTRVVSAKVRPYGLHRDRSAATAADHSSKTCDAVLAMPQTHEAEVPLEFPMFCPVVTEPRCGHGVPSAPLTPRHCGTPNNRAKQQHQMHHHWQAQQQHQRERHQHQQSLTQTAAARHQQHQHKQQQRQNHQQQQQQQHISKSSNNSNTYSIVSNTINNGCNE